MEFVVYVLEQFFSMGREKATQVMLAVHTQGKGVCGIYPQDIAERKRLRLIKVLGIADIRYCAESRAVQRRRGLEEC